MGGKSGSEAKMNIKLTYLWTLVLSVSFATWTFAETATELARRWMSDPPRSEEIALTPVESRAELITEIKRNVKHDFLVRTAQRILIELGDRETAEKLVAQAQSTDVSLGVSYRALEVFEGTTQPWVVPMLEPVLMRNEPITRDIYTYEDIERPPRSLMAAICIQKIMEKSPVFSQDMRGWAHGMAELLPHEKMRNVTRQWWLQNKEAFARKDYATVKPLQPVAWLPQPAATNRVPPATTITPTNRVTPPVKPFPAPVQPESSASPLLLLIGAGALALVAVAAVVVIRRRSEDRRPKTED